MKRALGGGRWELLPHRRVAGSTWFGCCSFPGKTRWMPAWSGEGPWGPAKPKPLSPPQWVDMVWSCWPCSPAFFRASVQEELACDPKFIPREWLSPNPSTVFVLVPLMAYHRSAQVCSMLLWFPPLLSLAVGIMGQETHSTASHLHPPIKWAQRTGMPQLPSSPSPSHHVKWHLMLKDLTQPKIHVFYNTHTL